MKDPFLHLHEVVPGIFEFSGLRTASIRDQLLRSYIAVKRCAKIGLIGPKRPLLVLGGGAAGVTSAMTATNLGIPVTLYEKNATLFERQQKCSRHLDPVEYDWPALHWDHGYFPWVGGQGPQSLPLSYVAAPAAKLAAQWSIDFTAWRTQSPAAELLSLRLNTKLSPDNVQPRAPDSVIALDPDTCSFSRFGAAFSCAGFATERVHASAPPEPAKDEFRGYPFWSKDPYDDPDFNLQTQTPRAIISGGGDGALQDFIRVLTGRTAKNLYQRLFSNIQIVDRYACMAADEEARRAYAWHHDPKRSAHGTLSAWHQRYVDEAERIYQAELTTNDKNDMIDELRDVEVTLVHSCNHFDSCYGLNRLLVLLLAMLHGEQTRRDWTEVLVGYTGVASVVASSETPHGCGDPDRCHDFRHVVSYKQMQCSGVNTGYDLRRPDNVDMVILRHGLIPASCFGLAPVPYQTVPYWLNDT